MIKVVKAGTRTGPVTVPSSKSVVHRLLICAALGEKPVKIDLKGLSDDILATAACLNQLGTRTIMDDNTVLVHPIKEMTDSKDMPDLPCRESGSTLRFLVPVVGALGRKASFIMEGRLPERPLSPYDSLLQEKGMTLRRETRNGGEKALTCSGHLRHGVFSLPGDISSQFFTGLMLALPLLNGDSILLAEGKMASEGYLRVTESILKQSGIVFQKASTTEWRIPGNQSFRLPERVAAEGDWSGAAFPLCLGAFSKAGISVSGLNMDSLQGDRFIIEFLKVFGASVECIGEEIIISSGSCKPFIIDAEPIPDLIPVLSVLACGASGDSRIINAGRLRLKESDRLRSTATMITALGGDVDELPDGLVIHGTGSLEGGTVDSWNDHRIAMSAAVAASICRKDVTVLGAECVRKSYPAFWDHLEEMKAE